MQNARLQEEQVTARRAGVLGMGFVDTSQIQKQLFKDVLSTPELKQLRVVPLTADDHNIHFGITTTTAQQTLNKLRSRFTDQRLTFSIISETGFKEYMLLYDPPKTVEYEDISITEPAAKAETGSIIDHVSQTLEQVRPDDMLAYLVQQAYELKASDIHLENQKDNVRVRYRVDGVLHPVAYISHQKYRLLSSSLASAANVSTQEEQPQTGHISRSYKMATGEEVVINLRVETVPTVYGMDAVMRLFNMRLELLRLENLGLSRQESAVVNEVIQHPTGMVLIVGPTGSGKTTTLYSLINTLNTPERKIITLEDPVEYNMPGVVQIPVTGELEGHDFAERLRAVLRLDPDVVMVGEIRDQDTARTALQGALTGHLVMSTFHAGSAAAALTRMLDMVGINPLFANAMHLVMAQRLVRRLDDKTKQAYQPDENLKSQLKAVIDSLPPHVQKPNLDGLTLYKSGKSSENPFGFSGQLALREQLQMTHGVQQLLRQPPNQITTEMLQAQAVQDGMRTMLHDGALKAIAGLTTIEEVYRVVG
ncbi:Flp pilus assembly complex ATPase component TadA [Candidatus Saccharibacteria bacterium]|nr:Flp pilus assembly complex ATPase component TadA [Candidatus Saccharibacteria bacterium]